MYEDGTLLRDNLTGPAIGFIAGYVVLGFAEVLSNWNRFLWMIRG